MRWTLLAAAGMATACTGAAASKDTAPSTLDSSGTTTTMGTTEPAPTGRITGRVVDENGQPWADATVNLCREICRLDRTDTDGRFAIEAEAGTWALEVVVVPSDPASGWSTPLAPIEVEVDQERVLEAPIVVYELDAIQALTARGELTLTEGFILTADPAEWDAPSLTPNAEPWLAAVRFDFATSGLPLDGLTGSVLDAWSVAPTATHPAAPWPLKLANPSLDVDATVEVWVSDYATQSWLLAGTVSSDTDGYLHGASLSALGTVLLVAP
ncbi:MAG TPA: hypothetical protein DFR83_07805 [Deltaproteobacteria bacterium]|nr:hypothetical protein [Deltaproteobacteria bacterium]